MILLKRHLAEVVALIGLMSAGLNPAFAQEPSEQGQSVAAGEDRPIHLLHGSGVHHVNVRAFDMDETISFYERAFGFKLIFRWNGVDGKRDNVIHFRNPLQGAHLDMGDGNVLEIIPAPKDAVRPSERAASLNHLGLRVSNLDETYARALANGAKPYPLKDGAGGVWDGTTTITLKAQPPFKRSFTVRAAHVMGPNGEIIELFES
jgi:catechol 2,3-dioxygenase-like lactoylglutathione lyase family enzyme